MITRECFVNLTEDNQLYEIFSKIKGGGEEGWQRPSDWLPLPDISSTEGISGLYAVWNTDSNFLAFTILGAYDVDWGDGNSGSYASGATAEHIYDWNDLSSSTLTTKGYRQAIVTITPASGDALTSIDFNVKHSTVGLASGATTGWLDVEVNAPSCTSSGLFSGSAVFHRLLEQATIHAWGGTSFNLMFNECASLQNPLLYNTNNVTNFSSMFRRCRALQTIPLFDTSSGTNFSSMFGGCFSLRIIPAFNFGGAAGSFDLIFIVSQINSLFKIEVTGVKTNFDISNQLLSSAALNEIYTNLADLTALPAQTITVTGNYGTAGDNPTIATAKNWTVTG